MTLLETGGKMVVNSAFKLGSRNFLVKSSQDVGDGDCDNIVVNAAATSAR